MPPTTMLVVTDQLFYSGADVRCIEHAVAAENLIAQRIVKYEYFQLTWHVVDYDNFFLTCVAVVVFKEHAGTYTGANKDDATSAVRYCRFGTLAWSELNHANCMIEVTSAIGPFFVEFDGVYDVVEGVCEEISVHDKYSSL